MTAMKTFHHNDSVVHLPTLMVELAAAGLDAVPMVINEKGEVHYDEAVAREVRDGVAAVLARHNPVLHALIEYAEESAAKAANTAIVDDKAVRTDRETEERLARYAAYATRNQNAMLFRLEGIDGMVVEVSAPEAVHLADSVLEWRLICEGRLADAIADIKAGKLKHQADIDARFAVPL